MATLVDAEKVIRAYLMSVLAGADLRTLVGERIYGGVDLPSDYRIDNGPAVLYARRGGRLASYNAVDVVDCQYQCYAASAGLAWETYRALFASFHEEVGQGIKQSLLETPGQLIKDPETGWPFILAGFRHWVVNRDARDASIPIP